MLAFIGNVIIRAVAWLGFGRRPLRAIKPRISSIPLATASLGSHEPERPLRPVGRAPKPAPAGPLWSGSGEYSTAVSENPTLSLLRRRAFHSAVRPLRFSYDPERGLDSPRRGEGFQWRRFDNSLHGSAAFQSTCAERM